MNHIIAVTSVGQVGQMAILCSCSTKPLFTENVIDLDELNDLAHDHIEDAEKGYVTKSAVTSADELIDLG